MIVPILQKFRFKMDLLDTIKGAWIQYISLFIVVFILLYKWVLGFAFQKHILESTVVSEIHKANLTILKLK